MKNENLFVMKMMMLVGLVEDEAKKALLDTPWEFGNVTTTVDVMFDCTFYMNAYKRADLIFFLARVPKSW